MTRRIGNILEAFRKVVIPISFREAVPKAAKHKINAIGLVVDPREIDVI
jgi:hypothetical protein